MNNIELQIINQVVIPVAGVVVSTVATMIGYYAKNLYAKHKDVVDLQSQHLQQVIGQDKYNADVQTVKEAVYAVEQQAKEFNWEGEMKHSKVLDMIEGKTGLTDEQVFNLIKGFVLQVNKLSK
jgi:hypothetical protein